MRILGIETSCDETAVAVIDVAPSTSSGQARVRVLSNIVASQVKLHAKFGGVVPHLAKREHQKNLVPILLAALKVSGLLRHELGSMKHESRKRKRWPHDSRFVILASILEREPDLFARLAEALAKRARMVPKVTALPAPNIDAIAVTIGPGLAPALWVGVNFARALAYLWGKPLIPVNHLAGHIYTNLLPYDQNAEDDQNDKTAQRFHRAKRSTDFIGLIALEFPALCLIVSGGHTELVLMWRYGDYRVLGETRDDAAGEAFDKVAKMMGLGFPGGPIISRLAETGDPEAFDFPRPMVNSANFDFSFSGLKTAVLYTLRDFRRISERTKRDIAASFEQAVADVLVAKTVRAAQQHRAKTVMIGGGVAANKKLRHQLGVALQSSLPDVSYLLPNVRLTGDNALMIALAGWFNRKSKTSWRTLTANANLRLDTPH